MGPKSGAVLLKAEKESLDARPSMSCCRALSADRLRTAVLCMASLQYTGEAEAKATMGQ